MAIKKYLAVHPKLYLNCQLDGDDKAKIQKVPVGTELEMEEAHAKNLLEAGKLEQAAAKKAKVVNSKAKK